MAHLNLSPSYVLQTVRSSVSTLLSKTQPLPRTTTPGNQSGPGEKTLFRGVTFHLGTLQPLDPLVWGKQLGLCQGGSPF